MTFPRFRCFNINLTLFRFNLANFLIVVKLVKVFMVKCL